MSKAAARKEVKLAKIQTIRVSNFVKKIVTGTGLVYEGGQSSTLGKRNNRMSRLEAVKTKSAF